MDNHFPWSNEAYAKLGPNIQSSNYQPPKSWFEERNELSLLSEHNHKTPLCWMAIVNELKHIINLKRKELGLGLQDYIDISISQLWEEQWCAIKNEISFLQKECQIRNLRIKKRNKNKPGNVLLNSFVNENDKVVEVWDYVRLSITSIKEKEYKVYDRRRI